MRRVFAFLVAGLLAVVSVASGADSKKLVLSFHGQSFFDLETSKGTRIVFDPHAIEAYGRPMVKADLILISHFHTDHTQVRVLQDYEKAKVIAGLKGSGKKTDWNIVDEKFKDVRVRTVGTFHDESQGMERGKNGVFVVEADGLHIVFLGDLGHSLSKEQIEKIGPVDVLMIPIGGVYTINGTEAKRVVEQLKPKQYIVPMHYGTKVFDEILPPDEFLEDQKKSNIRRESTNKLVIQTDFKPVEPIVVLLNWK